MAQIHPTVRVWLLGCAAAITLLVVGFVAWTVTTYPWTTAKMTGFAVGLLLTVYLLGRLSSALLRAVQRRYGQEEADR